MRPSVRRFAERMERKLRANDDKDHWAQFGVLYLSRVFAEEVGEVLVAVGQLAYARGKVARRRRAELLADECADVANAAMMIAEVALGATEEVRRGKKG